MRTSDGSEAGGAHQITFKSQNFHENITLHPFWAVIRAIVSINQKRIYQTEVISGFKKSDIMTLPYSNVLIKAQLEVQNRKSRTGVRIIYFSCGRWTDG